jgi:hypothetical protein
MEKQKADKERAAHCTELLKEDLQSAGLNDVKVVVTSALRVEREDKTAGHRIEALINDVRFRANEYSYEQALQSIKRQYLASTEKKQAD